MLLGEIYLTGFVKKVLTIFFYFLFNEIYLNFIL